MAKTNSGPSVSDLIEESVHLLRRHRRELVWYYIGTGPFAVALLYFWAYVAWFIPADGEVALGALLLAGLFGWMKAGQHRFATALLARRLGDEPVRWNTRRWLAEIAAQFRLQASGALLIPLAAVFGVPFGWTYAYYQSATVLPVPLGTETAERRRLAWEQMRLWPAQNHWALAIFSVLWLMVFLNIAVAFYAVPVLATQWLGLKTIFAFSGWSYLNSTFLVLVAVLTHLLVDPLIKAFYVLRVFRGGARKTGEDLSLVLAREKSSRRHFAAGAALLLVGLMFFPAPRMHAEHSVVRVQTAPPPVLDRALNQVLDQSAFRWRLHPLPLPLERKNEGIIKGFVRSTFEVLKQVVKTVARWIGEVGDWVSNLFPGGKSGHDDDARLNQAGGNGFAWMATLQLVAYVLLIAVGLFLIFMVWKIWRHNRETRPRSGAAEIPAATPDLRDETVEASRLPADGWLDLARKQMAAGEWRLALRALFLATLARHAHSGWLSLAKFKTNLDYEIELRRRAYGQAAVVGDFRDRRRQFEEVWYGEAPASDVLARQWLQQMEDRR
ncbi:MAG: hypothetical protein ABI273_15330 [Lacunisphaera sp.]